MFDQVAYVLVGSPFIFGIFSSRKEAEKHIAEANAISAHVHILEVPINRFFKKDYTV